MDVLSTGLAGVRAASLGIANTANNVANVNSADFKAKRLDFEDLAQGGVGPAALRESPEPRDGQGSNVDLATELINLQAQSGAYRANLKVIQTAEEILGTTLDMKA